MDIETELAKASLTRVEKRDPYKLFHKMTPAQLQALTPSFRWAAISKQPGAGHVGDQRQRAGIFSRKCRRCSKPTSWTIGRRICAGIWCTPKRFVLAGGVSTTRISISTANICAGGTDAAALEALRAARGWRHRRGAGPGIRRQDVRAFHQAKRARHDQGN
jgi:hypothetical protein